MEDFMKGALKGAGLNQTEIDAMGMMSEENLSRMVRMADSPFMESLLKFSGGNPDPETVAAVAGRLLIALMIPENQLNIIEKMFLELERADKKHADDPMSRWDMDASFNTLKCEVFELERELSRKRPDIQKIEKEAIQVMAMAHKFLRDVVYEVK